MAYTRPWTRQEDRYLCNWYRGAHRVGRLARTLHRSPAAVVKRWTILHHATVVKQRRRREALYGLLPHGMPIRDPEGTFCGTCGQDRSFGTDDGRCFAECRCGRHFIIARKP